MCERRQALTALPGYRDSTGETVIMACFAGEFALNMCRSVWAVIYLIGCHKL